MTKTKEPQSRPGFILNFENSNFGIVSNFGFRASNFMIGQLKTNNRISVYFHKFLLGRDARFHPAWYAFCF